MSIELGADPEVRRRLLWTLPAPLCVLGVGGDGAPGHLMTLSMLAQLSIEPCRLVIGLEANSTSLARIERGASAAVSLLREDQRALARKFVKPDDAPGLEGGVVRSIHGVEVGAAAGGAPYLLDSPGVLELVCIDQRLLGSHAMVLCEPVSWWAGAEVLDGPASAHGFAPLRVDQTRMNYGG